MRDQGKIADRYEPIRVLGKGGSGTVQLCRDSWQAGRQVALKIVEADSSVHVRNEYVTHRGLHHPNLVEVFDFHSLHDGRFAFALEFVDGPTIGNVSEPNLSPQLPGLLKELISVLGFLHDFDIIHRDLKPENVLLRNGAMPGNRVALLDLGMASNRREKLDGLSGTLGYIAPELFDGEAPSVRSDLFSVGTLTLELLLGRHPVAADPGSFDEFVTALRTRTVDPHEVDESRRALCDWALKLAHLDPSRRPAEAREAGELLAQIQGDHSAESQAASVRSSLSSGRPPGRDHLIREIRREIMAENSRVVILLGEHGSGKTRLLDWVRLEAIRFGWKYSDRPTDLEEGVGHDLFVIDDGHLLSPEAVDLIDAAARAETYGNGTICIAAIGSEVRSPQFKKLIDDSELSEQISRVNIAPFSGGELDRLLSRMNVAFVPDRDELHRKTAGHVGIVFEVLTSGETNIDRAIEGMGSRAAHRIGSLSESQREIVQALALCEIELSVSELSRALDVDQAAMLSDLRTINDRQILLRSDRGYRVASDVIVRAALFDAGEEELTSVARRLLGHLNPGDRPDVLHVLARLARLCGDKRLALSRALEAAERSERAGKLIAASAAYRLATTILERRDPRYHSLRLAHARITDQTDNPLPAVRSYAAAIRTAPSHAILSELYSLKARAMIRAGRGGAAQESVRQSYKHARDDIGRGLAALATASTALSDGQYQLAIESGERASQLLSECDHERLAEAIFLVGASSYRVKNVRGSISILKRAIRIAEGSNDLVTIANAEYALATSSRALKQYESAIRSLERVDALSQKPHLRRYALWAAAIAAEIHESQGRYDRALAEATKAERACRRLGQVTHIGSQSLRRAVLLLRIGRPAMADKESRSIIEAPANWFGAVPREFAALCLLDSHIAKGEEDRFVSRRDSLSEMMTKHAEWALTTIDLEATAAFNWIPQPTLFARLNSFDAERDSDAEMLARSWIAWSACELHRGDWRSALEAAVRARDVLKGAHHDLAAQVYLAMSRAHAKRGAKNEAEIALARGREELDAAAVLIEDEEYRNDFLARPVFRELRAKRHTFADAEDRLSALYEMSASLNSAHHPEDQLGVILDQALRAVRAERGLILLRSPGSEEYRVRVSRNLEEETEREAAEFSRTAVLAAEKGEPVLSINASDDERLKGMQSVSRFGIRSILCVPLRVRDETVGAVYADSRNDGAIFNPEDLRFLSAFANHAALALENAREMRELEARRDRLLQAAEERTCFGRIIGRSPTMQSVYTMVERVAGTHLPVLIHGESGTGKELIAREIVERSPRAGKPFLTENCAAIAETLLESELFGHVKGAFTGADADKPGLFEQADGGTLFLDEVGDMSPAMQARLLRVLQEGEIRRVGDESRRQVDVRVITASHRNLSQRVAEGEFREDLLHRLQVLVIDLPALRDRPLDVALLVDHFLERIAKERRQPKVKIRTEALERFERYSWPGNVRQLENTLQRLSLLAEDGVITMQTIEQDPTLRDALLGKSGQAVLSLKANEEQQLREALTQAKGNRVAAAKLLGVSRATIFRKIKQYDL